MGSLERWPAILHEAMLARMLSAERLRDLVLYDPETGISTNKINRRGGVRAGERPGVLHNTGYIRMGVEGFVYPAHRLAWLYVYGTFPDRQLDHIDGIKTNNAIVNLREADTAENYWNVPKPVSNTSGFKGVSWHPLHRKWRASISVRGVRTHLGLFTTAEEAGAAYEAACRQSHAAFARI